MKIVIHGTKGGYHIFTPERISGLIDARPDFNKVAAIGQQAYALNFNSDSVIFSFYRIIRDVIGEKRIGNITLSVAIPNNKKLSGEDAKALLDQLANEYCSKYIVGDNLDNVREDWTFVNALKSDYESRLRSISTDDVENIQQGTAEAAFVYYTTGEELQKYFDSPFQEDYRQFKQVFFVKSDLEGKPENPLNALRHNPSSNLTGQIDLENPKYKLLYNDNEYAKGGGKIEVRVNGRKQSNRSKIRRKNELEIIYTKPYRDEIRKIGRWHEISSEFVIVDDIAQTVTIREVELPSAIKNITFEVRDGKSNPIFDTEISVKNNSNQSEQKVPNHQLNFYAEELKSKYTATAQKGTFFGKKEFVPEKQFGSVIINLEESKKVTLFITDEFAGTLVNGIKIQVSTKRQPNGNEIEFLGDEIDKKWRINVSDPDGRYNSFSFDFVPANIDQLFPIKLRKRDSSGGSSGGGRKDTKYYTVSAGDHGTLKYGESCSSNDYYGSDVKDKIVPNKGYRFTEFQLINETLTARYQKKESFYKSPKFLASTITGIIAIIIVFFIFRYYDTGNTNGSPGITDSTKADQQQPSQSEAQEITTYCNGNELKGQQLEAYKEKYCNESKPEYCQKIEDAIVIRTAINQGKIDELKSKQYSENQLLFKNAVNIIEDRFKQQIGEIMNTYKVSAMSLDEVADFIAKLQKLLMIDINTIQTESDCEEQIQEIEGLNLSDIEIVKKIKEQIHRKKEALKKNVARLKDNNNSSSSSNIVAPSPPVIAPKPPTPKPPTPIQTVSANSLKANFWNLVHSGNVAKKSYEDLWKKYKGTSGNLTQDDKDILSYLNTICSDSKSFKKFKDIPEISRKMANTLTAIDINQQ